MKQRNIDCCSVFVGVVLLAIGVHFIYKIIVFFGRPDALSQIITIIETVGLCIGSSIALIIVVYYIDKLVSAIGSRFHRDSRFFLGQSAIVYLLPNNDDPIPEDLAEAPNQSSSHPVFVKLAMTNFGLWIIAHDPKRIETTRAIPDEENITRNFLREFNHSLIIPIRHTQLYYLNCHREGNLESEIGPEGSPGFKHKIPNVSEGDSLEIVIVFNFLRRRDSLGEEIRLKQPVKMKMRVVGRDGNYNLPATSNLYTLIYNSIQYLQELDDDSWLYQSRPIYW